MEHQVGARRAPGSERWTPASPSPTGPSHPGRPGEPGLLRHGNWAGRAWSVARRAGEAPAAEALRDAAAAVAGGRAEQQLRLLAEALGTAIEDWAGAVERLEQLEARAAARQWADAGRARVACGSGRASRAGPVTPE